MKMIFMLAFRGWAALTTTAVLMLAAACGGAPGPTGERAGRAQIVAAFYPFQFVAERVAGPHANVTSLTAPGAEPHDLELTPRQVGSLSQADLVLYERGFQPAVDEAVDQSGSSHVLETTTVVPLQPPAGGAAEQGHQDEQTGEDGHAHDAEANGLDPHVWLDPTNLARIATAAADRLAAADPTHAADFRDNAASLGVALTTLDHELRTGLQSCRRSEFITTHAAFGYLARRYGLTQIGVTGLSPDSEPSPARIAEVQREATEHQVTTIFYETLVSPAVAQSIAADLRLRTDVLDPVEGITDQSRGRDYLSVMRANLTALRTANACR